MNKKQKKFLLDFLKEHEPKKMFGALVIIVGSDGGMESRWINLRDLDMLGLAEWMKITTTMRIEMKTAGGMLPQKDETPSPLKVI